MSNKHSYNSDASITLRRANFHDDEAVDRLAQLEGLEVPAEPILLAEVGGRVLAALSITDGTVIADPFAPTAHLVEMLKAHAYPRPSSGRRRFGAPRPLARRAPWPA